MPRDPLDILHHRGGIAENVAVDVLQNVAGGRAGCGARHKICVVDVTVAVWRQPQDFAAKLELLCHSPNFGGIAHDQSRSGYLPSAISRRTLSITRGAVFAIGYTEPGIMRMQHLHTGLAGSHQVANRVGDVAFGLQVRRRFAQETSRNSLATGRRLAE